MCSNGLDGRSFYSNIPSLRDKQPNLNLAAHMSCYMMACIHYHVFKSVWTTLSALQLSSTVCFFLLVTSANHTEAAKGDVPGCHHCIGKRVYQEGCQAINVPTKITTNRYYLFNLHRMSWFTAHQFCIMHGMQLATIANEQENEELLALMKTEIVSDVWFGVTDLAEEGKYSNTKDGSPVEFAAWLPGEPNNHGGNEHCVRFMNRDGRVAWNDDTCAAQHYVACDLTP